MNMRTRARQVDPAAAPAAIRPYIAQPSVTVGKEYEVHAATVYEGLVLLQIVDDLDCVGWKPAWLFDVVDSAIPTDWICSAFHGEPSLVLGPDFVAGSLEGYAAMVDLESNQIAKFWTRVKTRSKAP